MRNEPLKKALLDWANTFMEYSLNDLTRYAHSIGLSLAQMSILMHLHYRGACEVTHFSESLKISRAAASQMIDRLVQQGVVQRYLNPQDRRVRMVDLTDFGKKIVKASKEVQVDWVNELVNRISEKDREQFLVMLNRLNQYAKQEYI